MSARILIMEDDEGLRELVTYELESEGYAVTAAPHGQAGLETAQNGHRPDLILLDVMMPGLTGFQVCTALQNDPRTATIPVIFLTACATLDDKLTGLEAGGIHYLTKPFKMAELKAQIKALLNHTTSVRQQEEAVMQATLEQAADIQRSLIPQVTPTIRGLDLHAEYRSATKVSGDFYDIFVRPDGQLVFVEADVSGKSLPAALVMASVRTAVRRAARSLKSPRSVLEQVNAELYEDLSEVQKFVTIFIGFYNPYLGLVHYANAGHPPVIYCPADESACILEPDGPPLGVLPDVLSQDHNLILEKEGDLLAICSDGLSKAQDPTGEMFGYDRLLEAVNRLRYHNASGLGSGLFQQVAAFATSRHHSDDQTLLVLKRGSDEQR